MACTLDYEWPRYVVAALISLFGGVVILLPFKFAWQAVERRRRRRRLTTFSGLESTLCQLQSGAERVLEGPGTVNKIIVSPLRLYVTSPSIKHQLQRQLCQCIRISLLRPRAPLIHHHHHHFICSENRYKYAVENYI